MSAATSRPRKRAFTLIELLVIIAIVAVLSAILFPVFSQAKEKARQKSCASNLKQIGLGILLYMQDFDERYPITRNDTATIGTGGSSWSFWKVNIFPYVKSTDLFTCPSGVNATKGTYILPGGQKLTFAENYSYGANELIVVDGRSVPPVKQSDLRQAASIGLLADSTYPTWNNPSRIINANTPAKRYPPNGALPRDPNPQWARHTQGVNIVYADGHARWQSQPQIRGTIANPNIYQWGLIFAPKDPRAK